MKSTHDELTAIYKEYDNKKEYKADFYDITQGDSRCKVGWDLCARSRLTAHVQGEIARIITQCSVSFLVKALSTDRAFAFPTCPAGNKHMQRL